ncbi:metallophosphoesterase [Leuconostoc fallax]|uniref:YfcE family phosphodiesterase n=1 Tax=Leuconostoc fallax TaxID=1251 RepID=UPI002091A64A|nr:metallophosphoesterase [Leuconostoc fallax]
MVKILIISDIHGDRDILVDIIKKWQADVTAIFYNGDSELSADDSVFDGVSTVIGNMDDDPDFADGRSTTIDDVTIFQTHGHLYRATVLTGWANLALMDEAADEAQAQIVLFGHTHKLGAEMYHQKLFINPGSTTLPKGEYANLGGTYAILDVTASTFTVQFYNRQHQLLTTLTRQFER